MSNTQASVPAGPVLEKGKQEFLPGMKISCCGTESVHCLWDLQSHRVVGAEGEETLELEL